MKRWLFLSSLVAIISTTIFLLTACGDDDDTVYTIKLNRSSILISSIGASESIEIKASDNWKVQDTPDWLSITPSSGENIGLVVIIVKPNDGVERRKASITFVCGDATETLEIEQLASTEEDSFITLSKETLNFPVNASIQTMKVITSHDWKLESLPNWVHSNIMSGSGTTEIILTVDENIEPKGRAASLNFASGRSTTTLTVKQAGLADYISFPILPIFNYKKIQLTDKQNIFEVEMTDLFINPSIKSKVYLGNLICPTWDNNINIPTFAGYTFNPIKVSTSAVIVGDIAKTFTPSLSEQDGFAKYIVEKKPKQGESFKADNGTTEFYSYKQLYTIGMVNMGVKLDELISGTPYLGDDMPKKYGLIFSFKSILFSLQMDSSEKLTKEKLNDADVAKGVSYVSKVGYGKVGLLVVESDTYYLKIKDAINKAIVNQTLTSEESSYIATSNISYVYFNNNKEPKVLKGGMDAIMAYKKSMTVIPSENIYPVSFNLADYFTHSLNSISYTTKVPAPKI